MRGRWRWIDFVVTFAIAVPVATPVRAEEPNAVFIMQPDGGQARQLVRVDELSCHGYPRWSHDGTHLVFARNGYLWLISASGGPPIAITAVDENIASSFSAATPFEQAPYIFPGEDVWTTTDWAR